MKHVLIPHKKFFAETVLIRDHNIFNKGSHVETNARLQLLLENFQSRKGHNYV